MTVLHRLWYEQTTPPITAIIHEMYSFLGKCFKVWKLTSGWHIFYEWMSQKRTDVSISDHKHYEKNCYNCSVGQNVCVFLFVLFFDFMCVTYLCVRCPFHFSVVGLRLSHAWWNGKTHIFLSGSLAIDHMPMSTTIWQLWVENVQANTSKKEEICFRTNWRIMLFDNMSFVCTVICCYSIFLFCLKSLSKLRLRRRR